ncbi:MAG: CBS domain-containing protein [Acetobacteraceae bacterium]|nr:CBS domain-containing protein [Acetobacteraceae bacterium]
MNRPMSEIIKRQAPLVLPQTTTVSDACRLMRERRVGAALVTGGDDGRRLVGIFTGRDAVCRVLAEGKPAATTELSEVMTRDPEAMPPEGMATEALRLMRDCGFRHVPVVDRGRAVGVVSRSDFLGLEQARLDDEVALREHN